jgi:hypothetical protein
MWCQVYSLTTTSSSHENFHPDLVHRYSGSRGQFNYILFFSRENAKFYIRTTIFFAWLHSCFFFVICLSILNWNFFFVCFTYCFAFYVQSTNVCQSWIRRWVLTQRKRQFFPPLFSHLPIVCSDDPHSKWSWTTGQNRDKWRRTTEEKKTDLRFKCEKNRDARVCR